MAASIMYVSQAGAGAKDGSSPDNAFDFANFVTDITTLSEAGDIYYVLGPSQTYTLLANVITLGGAAATYTKIIGVTDLTTLAPAYGDDRPLFVCGAYYLNNNWYILFRNLRLTGSATYVLRMQHESSMVVNCSVVNTSTSSNRYGIYLERPSQALYYCTASTAGSSGAAITSGNSASTVYGCSVTDSVVGINLGTNGSILNCVATNCPIGISAGTAGKVINCIAYNCATYGISCQYSWQITTNNIIHTCGTGIYRTNTTLDKDSSERDYNVIYNCTNKYSSDGGATEDLTLAGAHDSYDDPQFVDAPSGDFRVGANMRAKGFEFLMPNGVNVRTQIGAIVLQETLPAIADVKKDVQYGANGTELTGTYEGASGGGEFSYGCMC